METHVQTLARAQAALGASVRVVCVDHVDHAGEPDRGASVVVAGEDESICADSRCDAQENAGHLWEADGSVRVLRMVRRSSFNRLDWVPGLPELLQAIIRDGTDVLHLHTPNPTMLLALAIARPEVTLVITHHSDIIRQKVLRWFQRPFERVVYARAARIQTTSDVYRQGSSFLTRYADRLEVLPLGVDLSPYRCPSPAARQHTEELRRRHPGPLWLAVGRLVYYKALHVAIRALASVPGTLILIGTGPLENELKQLADSLGVTGRIVWSGYASKDELVGSYWAADALWFPSNARSEAFGLVQVEAMACGCPVINTDIPGSGVPWVSRHGETGLTVPVNDPIALAAAATQLLEDPRLRRRLAEGARQRASAEFDHLVMANRSLSIYHRSLGGQRSALESLTAAGGLADATRSLMPMNRDLFPPALAPADANEDAGALEEDGGALHEQPQPHALNVPRVAAALRGSAPASLRPAADAP